jgi:RNA polymerase sigma-70 factor (ECF subfamily)
MTSLRDAPPPLDEIFRAEWGRLCAALARMLGDLDRAEEIAQEALVVALERWPFSGVPEKPGAWLMTTARNRALDWLRHEKRVREKRPLIEEEHSGVVLPDEESVPAGPLSDDRLRLIFTCCHPALTPEGRVALTLRLLGGLTTQEIAAAFLVSEATAAQRIVRAKRAVRDRRLPYRVPEPSELPARLPSVLEVVYLIFNEGYAARDGDALVRAGLCDEALRLARLLESWAEGDSEVQGLLALMELHAARQATRADAQGDLVLLEDQDRSRWDRVGIERARRRAEQACASAEPGPYALQAAIAACHASAPSFADTDWRRIATLYAQLARETGSPVVELNRAVAVAMADGLETGLALLGPLEGEPQLRDYALLPATRAELLRRLGRGAEAAPHFRRALALTRNAAERRHLERRLAECEGAGS